MPAWEDLPERTVNAWVAAVCAMLKVQAEHAAPITVDVHINGNLTAAGALHESVRRAVVDHQKRNQR